MIKPNAPIGVFDSGVGGLSVFLEIKKLLPHEKLIYVADSGHVPYGNKSPEFILQRSEGISNFLISRGVKAIVIACNTATASSILSLRKRWPEMIFVGMEPAVKPALALTKKGIVGVLATVGTLKSAQFAALLDKFGARTKVVTQPAPGLVECVERGDLKSQETQNLVSSFVDPLIKKGADVIVLGCTHYPFLSEAISRAAGREVALVDTGAAVARQLQAKLKEFGLTTQERSTLQSFEFFSSGDLQEAKRVVSSLTGISVEVKAFSTP